MHTPLSTVVSVLALLLCWGGAPAAAADLLRVGGTGGATALLGYLGKPFTAQTAIAVEVVAGLGSGGGINAAADGVLDVAVSGRPLSQAERARALVAALAIRTPYVLATSRALPTAMEEGDILAAFSKEKAYWPDGTLIKLILRPRPESDNLALVSLFAGMEVALGKARERPELPVAATDQDNADLAESLPGSLIGATYTQIKMEARKLQMIAINGVAPSIEAFDSGAYRYTKVLYVLHREPASNAARRFVQFMHSEDGIRAMREAGCLPVTE
jgi:phosphate transport system substrate-binding protein